MWSKQKNQDVNKIKGMILIFYFVYLYFSNFSTANMCCLHKETKLEGNEIILLYA